MLARAIALVGVLMVCYGTWQTVRANHLRVTATENQIELRTCAVRLENLIEDIERDAQAASLVNNLDDIPTHWLRQPSD